MCYAAEEERQRNQTTRTLDDQIRDLTELKNALGPMKRDLQFASGGTLAESLGISEERLADIDRRVQNLMTCGTTLQEVISVMNDGGLTDAEWSVFMFSLGFMDAQRLQPADEWK